MINIIDTVWFVRTCVLHVPAPTIYDNWNARNFHMFKKKKKKLFTDCTSLIVCVWGLDRDRKKLSGYKKMWGGKRCAGLWTVSAAPLEWNDTSCEERPLVSVILCLSCRSLWLSVSFGVCQNGIKLLSQWLVSSTLTDLSGNGRYGFEHFNVVFFFFFFLH